MGSVLAFTYLWFGLIQIYEIEMQGFGWYSAFVAAIAAYYAIKSVGNDPMFAVSTLTTVQPCHSPRDENIGDGPFRTPQHRRHSSSPPKYRYVLHGGGWGGREVVQAFAVRGEAVPVDLVGGTARIDSDPDANMLIGQPRE